MGAAGATGPTGSTITTGPSEAQVASGTSTLAVSFDTDARYVFGTARITGSATPGTVAVEIYDGTTDLGAAKVDSQTGRWVFGLTPGGSYDALSATATDASGATSSSASPYALTTHQPVRQFGFAATQDNYDPVTGDYLGSNYYRRDGSLQYASTYQQEPDGNQSYTYSSGNFFNDKGYYAFTDTYDPSGTLVTHEEVNDDGSRSVEVVAPGQTVASQYLDTFAAQGQAHTTFVFTPGYGEDTVTGFMASGRGHDVLSFASSDFASVADVLRHTQDTSAGALITDPTSGDSVTVAGVTTAQLSQHKQDISLHG